MLKTRTALVAALLVASVCTLSLDASAETLMGALSKAYSNNATLNSSRAGVRITDEDIAIAKSSFRPTIQGVGSYARGRSAATTYYSTVGSLGIQLSQNIFDGFQTKNNVSSAEARAEAQREALRNEEQNQLNNAAGAYANLYAARRIAALRQENLAALEEQVRSDRAKLEVGEGTRTDLAQSEASRSRAKSELSQAIADVKSAEAVYRQVIGADPDQLEAPTIAKGLPEDIEQGLTIARAQHPAILSAKFAMDASAYSVKAKEGALLPQVGLTASTSYNEVYDGPGNNGRSNSIGVQLTVPIYQGGRNSAQIRQSKEQLGQARINVDLYEQNVREALASAWANLEGLKDAVKAYKDSVDAAQIALDGRVQENRVGQATTLDVLESRSQLITMQVSLITAQRDLVIASYNVKAATGQMTADKLGLKVAIYDAGEHYRAVRNKWIGTKTPDGR